MNLIKVIDLEIWGRVFLLNVIYDCYEGETVTKQQIDAANIFAANSNWVNNAKKQIEAYCSEDVQKDDENHKKDNIFSYIKPEAIFVKRESNPRVAIMCKYRYDMEHGLAIVFDSTGKVTVGSQDIIL